MQRTRMTAHRLCVLWIFFASICFGRRQRKQQRFSSSEPGTLRSSLSAELKERKERCGDTHKVPYTAKEPGLPMRLLPEASILDRCKGSDSLGNRLLITDTLPEKFSTEWMQKHISIPHLVYFAGGRNESHRHEERGWESTGYLTFIAEYYDCLPDVTLFAHPHRESYHSYWSLDKAVNLVRWEHVPGFSPLHLLFNTWSEFNPYDPVSNLGPPLNDTQEKEVPCEQIFNDTAYGYRASWEYRRAEFVSRAWDGFFSRTVLGEMPPKLRMTLVGEFFVRRERIRLRPRQFYLQALQWSKDVRDANELSAWELTVVFELLWHYIFGEPAYLQKFPVEPCTLFDCGGQDLSG